MVSSVSFLRWPRRERAGFGPVRTTSTRFRRNSTRKLKFFPRGTFDGHCFHHPGDLLKRPLMLDAVPVRINSSTASPRRVDRHVLSGPV